MARVDVETGVGAGTLRDAMVRIALLNAQKAPAVTFGVPAQIDVDCQLRACTCTCTVSRGKRQMSISLEIQGGKDFNSAQAAIRTSGVSLKRGQTDTAPRRIRTDNRKAESSATWSLQATYLLDECTTRAYSTPQTCVNAAGVRCHDQRCQMWWWQRGISVLQ